ncbi:TetR/AcrR family transcriptional regulator [Oceanicaulis sp. LC35]|uniref:TetR/AcrR family transcriptional regulator n=1 Tax=Oceanicaulis sp. LC35 TaxID=3349635 RepID=UPI003F834DB6
MTSTLPRATDAPNDNTAPTLRGRKTREKLIDAARGALIEGAGEAEITDIASRAGVSAGLAYHHFGSKDGLVSAVVEDFYARYVQIANTRFRGETWAQREVQRVQAVIRFLIDEPFTRTLFGPLGRSSAVVHAESHCMADLVARGARNIAQGQADGDLPRQADPNIAAAFVLGGLRQSVTLALLEDPAPDAEQLARAIWILIAQSLGLREGSKS